MTANTEQPKNIGQTTDDVDRIRDIIFGGQMREYQQRFEQLERSVTDSIERLAGQVDARFNSLQTELAAETAQRAADAAVGKTGLADLDQRVQQALAAQEKSLLKAIDETRNQLAKTLGEDTARLSTQKVGAEELAKLLSELANRLSSSR
jgi:hypothetical protein